MKKRLVGALIAGFLAAALTTGASAGLPSDLCLLPVKDGTPTEADFGRVSLMVNTVRMLPGIDRPVIHRSHGRGMWTIDHGRRFVPFGEPLPPVRLNATQVVESATGRVVAVGYAAVYVARPGEENFRQIPLSFNDASFRNLTQAYVARLGRTIIATSRGLMVLNDEKLEPVEGERARAIYGHL